VGELEELLSAENPQIKLNKSNIDVGYLLRLLDGQFAPAFQEKGVSLNIQKPTKEYWLHADQDRVLQVLTNIINNALRSEEHTSELQSRFDLVCRLLLEKKK